MVSNLFINKTINLSHRKKCCGTVCDPKHLYIFKNPHRAYEKHHCKICNKNHYVDHYDSIVTFALTGHLDKMKKLLQEKPETDINLMSDCLNTPLMIAVYQDNIEMVKFLLEQKGIDLFNKNLENHYVFNMSCYCIESKTLVANHIKKLLDDSLTD